MRAECIFVRRGGLKGSCGQCGSTVHTAREEDFLRARPARRGQGARKGQHVDARVLRRF